MKTFKRICIKGYEHPEARKLIEKGKEYITSIVKDGKLTVFTRYWFEIDKKYFAGAEKFTTH